MRLRPPDFSGIAAPQYGTFSGERMIPSQQALEVGYRRQRRMKKHGKTSQTFECLDCGGNLTISFEGKRQYVDLVCDGPCGQGQRKNLYGS